jgi:hypothetical protein
LLGGALLLLQAQARFGTQAARIAPRDSASVLAALASTLREGSAGGAELAVEAILTLWGPSASSSGDQWKCAAGGDKLLTLEVPASSLSSASSLFASRSSHPMSVLHASLECRLRMPWVAGQPSGLLAERAAEALRCVGRCYPALKLAAPVGAAASFAEFDKSAAAAAATPLNTAAAAAAAAWEAESSSEEEVVCDAACESGSEGGSLSSRSTGSDPRAPSPRPALDSEEEEAPAPTPAREVQRCPWVVARLDACTAAAASAAPCVPVASTGVGSHAEEVAVTAYLRWEAGLDGRDRLQNWLCAERAVLLQRAALATASDRRAW